VDHVTADTHTFKGRKDAGDQHEAQQTRHAAGKKTSGKSGKTD